MIRVAVLLSIGRHPASGRPRPAPRDASALELALRLPKAQILAVHAGDPAEPTLRSYLGMGLPEITVLATPEGADPAPPLIARLRRFRPDLVLAGAQAESGEDSGMVPYLVAEALGASVAPDLAELNISDALDAMDALLALPRGRRRRVRLPLPAVLAVGAAGPAPRQPSFAAARRGTIRVEAVEAEEDAFLAACAFGPYRERRAATRLRGSALDRLKAATESRSGEGRLMIDPTPEDAAEAIYAYLLSKGVTR